MENHKKYDSKCRFLLASVTNLFDTSSVHIDSICIAVCVLYHSFVSFASSET